MGFLLLRKDDVTGFVHEYPDDDISPTCLDYRKHMVSIAEAFVNNNIRAKRVVLRETAEPYLEETAEVIWMTTSENITKKDYHRVTLDSPDRLILQLSNPEIVGWVCNSTIFVRADLDDAQVRIDKFFDKYTRAAKAELKNNDG
jgi:hypothetical protein